MPELHPLRKRSSTTVHSSLAGPKNLSVLTLIALSAFVLPAQAQEGWPWQNEPRYDRQRAPAERPTVPDYDTPYMKPTGTEPPNSGWQAPAETQRGPSQRPPASYQEGPAFRPPVTVESSDLAPVMAGDGSGLPYELWNGLDSATFEKLLADIEIPPRSNALHGLWRRLMTAEIRATGAGDGERFEAIRLEALYRSGLTADMQRLMQSSATSTPSPAISVLLARAAIADGNDDEACSQTQGFLRDLGRMPRMLAGEAVMISGYCVTRSGNSSAAGVAAGFAREQGVEEGAGLAALDAIAHGGKPKLKSGHPVSLIDYKLLAKAGYTDISGLLPGASPALLVALTRDPQASSDVHLSAGEAAARLNAITAEELSAIYRRAAMSAATTAQATPQAAGGGFGSQNPHVAAGTPAYRAILFLQAETEQTPFRKVRAIRTYLDEARRANLYIPALQTMGPAVQSMRPVPEISWFSETAIEVLLASNEPQVARSWLNLSDPADPRAAGQLNHWRALIDISDVNGARHGQSLAALEHLALRGVFVPDQLHRIATVLDALDYQIPIPLWEAASRTPQPSTGHLPETGVLSRLQNAAKAKEFGRTVLLTMNALGPKGAEGAHMIALGDAIRALKSAGLEAEARRLGFEALFPAWPRQVSG
ncbi:conserved exported protein of unknown function [Candidatus Filomicrobium marinum]|uniref:Antifreeze glycopeptide polyprotein n=1 Tax=Candidatus Filomicrobium marinum TaxID=1608628 RepID=A0A0D6JBG9_9HYPH|nr:conserved exported protein of unknown function [Candidatus Filomicrobium marinum]CPR16365.1 conserved exported protein of unknown function [Candidatus Filomicrobium marinum]